MGFNKLYLPEIDRLKQQLLKEGNEAFTQYWVGRYAKADAIIGSTESAEFIRQFIQMEYEEDNNQPNDLVDSNTNTH